jgi:hypothetical protein
MRKLSMRKVYCEKLWLSLLIVSSLRRKKVAIKTIGVQDFSISLPPDLKTSGKYHV